jgi:hypothetical protein
MGRFLLALALSAGLAGCADPEPPRPAPLSCEISGDATCVQGNAPKITVRLTNRTGREVLLIGSLDGSDCKMRYPHAYFVVTGPGGGPAVKGVGRCGNTNPLTEKCFAKVPAGGSFDPYGEGFFGAHQLSGQTFTEPGKYRIRFVYSTEPKHAADFGGTPRSETPFTPEVAKMLERVPKATVTSNEIVVEVKK